MLDLDKWREIMETLGRHKLRTGLTAFGVFWGIFMLVALLGSGNGLENGIMRANFASSTNAVWVWNGSPALLPYKGLPKGRRIALRHDDIAMLKNKIPEIDLIAPGNGIGTTLIVHRDKSDSFEVSGVYPDEFKIRRPNLLAGRFLNAFDIQERRKVAVIGTRVKEMLFGTGDAIGKEISIYGIHFRVVGVSEPAGLNNNAEREAERVYLPNTTLRYTFNQADLMHVFVMVPKPGVDSEIIEQKAVALLKERHRFHPDETTVVGHFNMQKEFDKVQDLFHGIRLFSWIVAIGTIVAGVIGVSNIMLIVVKERTKEIGIRKAIGATPTSIVAMIVQESLVITLFAGYFGLVAGVAMLELVGNIASSASPRNQMFANPQIDFTTAGIAIFTLLVAGALACLLPARRAARIDPVIALQDQ